VVWCRCAVGWGRCVLGRRCSTTRTPRQRRQRQNSRYHTSRALIHIQAALCGRPTGSVRGEHAHLYLDVGSLITGLLSSHNLKSAVLRMVCVGVCAGGCAGPSEQPGRGAGPLEHVSQRRLVRQPGRGCGGQEEARPTSRPPGTTTPRHDKEDKAMGRLTSVCCVALAGLVRAHAR
jgi:hypothetical protein